MGNKPKAYAHLYHSAAPQLTYTVYRARWKYMICTVAFAALMVYVLYAAVMCSIQAAHNGDSAYSVMLFSIIITYGSACMRLIPKRVND